MIEYQFYKIMIVIKILKTWNLIFKKTSTLNLKFVVLKTKYNKIIFSYFRYLIKRS